MTTKKTPNISLIRVITIIILLIGAVLSAILTIKAGHKNASVVLPALFLIWVLSPFVVLLFVSFRYKHSSHSSIRYTLMILLSVISVIAYTGMLNPIDAKPASVFLFTPLISWVLIILGSVIMKKRKLEQQDF